MKEIANLPLRLDCTTPQKVDLPAGTKVLCLRILGNQPVVWFLCDPDQVLVPRQLLFVRTNYPLADDFEERWDYVESLPWTDGKGMIVFHLFIDLEQIILVDPDIKGA